MEHEKDELREAQQLGIEQADDIYRFGDLENESAVEDAVENNPYKDPMLSRKYWQGYLAEVEKKDGLDFILRQVCELAGKYFDSEDTLERLSYINPFPFGSKLYTAFLDGYFYFTEAFQESRYDVVDDSGGDWQPDKGLIDDLFNDENDWRNSFFEKMSKSEDVALPSRLYKFRRLETEEDVSRVTDGIILGHELWFPKVSQLNDLFEFELRVKNDLPAPSELGIVNFWDVANHQLDQVWVPKTIKEKRWEEMRNLIKKSEKLEQGFKKAWGFLNQILEKKLTLMRDELGVCSFAGNVENTLLWAHDAGDNRGVALGFSHTTPFWSGLRRVQYTKAPPVFSSTSGRLDDKMARAIITKDKKWSYEDEWRLIGQPSRISDPTSTGKSGPDSRHTFPKRDLVEVVFGPLITNRNRQTIFEACTKAGLTPKFFEACKATGYKLEIREWIG